MLTFCWGGCRPKRQHTHTHTHNNSKAIESLHGPLAHGNQGANGGWVARTQGGTTTMPIGSDCPEAVAMAIAISRRTLSTRRGHRLRYVPVCWYPQVSADPVGLPGTCAFFARIFQLYGPKSHGATPGTIWSMSHVAASRAAAGHTGCAVDECAP